MSSEQVGEHELRVAVESFFWGERVEPDASKVADELVPFLMQHYDITPKPIGGNQP